MDGKYRESDGMEVLIHFQTALDKHMQGEHEAAIFDFEKVLEQDPAFVMAYCFLSAIYVSKNEWDKGIHYALQGLRSAPQNEYLHYSLAVAYEKSHRGQEAINHYEFYLERHPDDAEGHFSLGSNYYHIGQKERAKESFIRAVASDAAHYRAAYNLALIAHEKNETNEAVKWFQQSVNANPKFLKGWMKLGALALQRNHLAEAVKAYTQAILINDDQSDAYFNLGLAYLKQGDFKAAIQNFEVFLAKKTDHPLALMLAGECYLNLQEGAKAVAAYQKLLLQDTHHNEAHCALGLAYLQVGDQIKARKEASYLQSIHSPLASEILQLLEKQ